MASQKGPVDTPPHRTYVECFARLPGALSLFASGVITGNISQRNQHYRTPRHVLPRYAGINGFLIELRSVHL